MPMVFAGIVLSASTVEARVVLPHVLSDGMVLQQQTDVRLRGKATPGCKVEVTGSWMVPKLCPRSRTIHCGV